MPAFVSATVYQFQLFHLQSSSPAGISLSARYVIIWRWVSRIHPTFCSWVEWLNMLPNPNMTAWATLLLPLLSTVGQLLGWVRFLILATSLIPFPIDASISHVDAVKTRLVQLSVVMSRKAGGNWVYVCLWEKTLPAMGDYILGIMIKRGVFYVLFVFFYS